jgi:hypothetical protein
MLPCVSPNSLYIEAFQQVFRRRAGLDHDDYVVGYFGESSVMRVVNFPESLKDRLPAL